MITIELRKSEKDSETGKGKQTVVATAKITGAPLEKALKETVEYLFTEGCFAVQARKVLWESKEGAKDIEISYEKFLSDCKNWASVEKKKGGNITKGKLNAAEAGKIVARYKAETAAIESFREFVPIENMRKKYPNLIIEDNFNVRIPNEVSQALDYLANLEKINKKNVVTKKIGDGLPLVFDRNKEVAILLNRFDGIAVKLPKKDREKVREKINSLSLETEVLNMKKIISDYEASFK